jgi:hypothetical protein
MPIIDVTTFRDEPGTEYCIYISLERRPCRKLSGDPPPNAAHNASIPHLKSNIQ